MRIWSRPTAARIRTLLSLAAVVTLSSAVLPGAVPHRARPVRTGGGLVQRPAVSRWNGGSTIDPHDRIAVVAAASVRRPATPTAGNGRAVPPAAAAPASCLWTAVPLLPPPLSAHPWRALSRFESRPPPIA